MYFSLPISSWVSETLGKGISVNLQFCYLNDRKSEYNIIYI